MNNPRIKADPLAVSESVLLDAGNAIRERNKELMLLIERDRIKRFREQQRKELEIGVGKEVDPPTAEPAPGR